MKKANFTIRQTLAALLLLFCAGSVMAQVDIERDWNPGGFNGEVGWEIIEVATQVVHDCEQSGGAGPSGVPTTISVPLGTYEVRGFDSFGDGWNGGILNVNQGGGNIFSSSGPPAVGFNPANNNCNGIPSPVNTEPGAAILGTFNVAAICNPALSCPSNITVDNTQGICGAIVNFSIDDAGCAVPAVADPPSGSVFPVGSTVVVVESGGAANQCTFSVTVNDTEAPTIVCPGDVTINLGDGECGAFFSYEVAADDNCAGFAGPLGSVTAPAGNSNGQDGIQFDVRNDGGSPQTLTSFDIRFAGNGPVEVWYTTTASTAIGNATSQGAWTLLGSAVVAGNGFTGGSSTVNVPVGGLTLAPGESKGIYVTGVGPTIVGYSNGNLTSTDGVISIVNNGHSGGTYPFGSQFSPRRFHGNVNYQTIFGEPEIVQDEGLASGEYFTIGETENCFTATGPEGLTAECCFTVTVVENPNATQNLTCNDNVQISLDENCSATVGADMILEGGPYGCFDTRYTVMILTPLGANIGNVVDASAIGPVWTVKVVDNETDQSCWGSIVVEDKLPPVIECRDLTIDCNAELPAESAPAFVGPNAMIIENIGEPLGEPGAPTPDVHSYDFDYSFYPAGTPVQDVDVVVELIEHTWLPDLDIVVTSPSGTEVDVFAVTGCFGAEFPIDCIFDDEGQGGITQCAQLDAGGARLQGFQNPGVQSNTILEAFDGEDAGGVWSLTYSDVFAADDGVIMTAGLIVTADAPAVAPSDNCTNPPTVDVEESYIDDSCGGPAGQVVRTWTATDAYGNSASCVQTITYARPTVAEIEMPSNIKWSCDQYNAYATITEALPLHPYITDCDGGTDILDATCYDENCDDSDQSFEDNADINSTVNGGGCAGPGLDDADVLELTGSGVPTIGGDPLVSICEIGIEHEDIIVQECVGSFKIVRQWTIIDWCSNPIDVRQENQVIKVVDEEAPVIPAPASPTTVDVYNATATGNIHTVCEGSVFVPPVGAASDNCSGVDHYITELWTVDQAGNPVYQIGTIAGNGGYFDNISMYENGLPARYVVRYYAVDGCKNQSFVDMVINLRDKVPPVAICDEITEVAITNNGQGTGTSCSTLYAEDLDDGSYDNCAPVHFLMAKMDDSFSQDIYNRCYYPSRDFCCEDVGDQTVILLVLDVDPTPFFNTTITSASLGCDEPTPNTPSLFLSPGTVNFTVPGTGQLVPVNFNTCMVTVQVSDKLPPVLIDCPDNTRITCDFYADNFETQLANAADDEEQCDILNFFGDATYFDNCVANVECNVTFNLDQCLEGTIRRTWTAEDDAGNTNSSQNCNQTIFVDHVSDFVVEFPEDISVECGSDVPDFGEPSIFFESCELVAVSYDDNVYTDVADACYKIERQWTVINWCVVGDEIDQEVEEDSELDMRLSGCLSIINLECDLDGDGDCDDRTFRDSWSSCNLPNASQATQSTDPDSDPDSDPWDGYITYEQIIKVNDTVDPVFTNGCDIPDVCISDNTCGATVLLPTPDLDECSEHVTWSYEIEIGGTWLSGAGPYLNVAPGTYPVRYVASDNCNNQTACETSVTVADCKKPTPYCKSGIVVELMVVDPAMVEVWASDLDDASFDNCPGALKFSFSADVDDTGATFTCDDLGQNSVELWVTDAAGNQDFCITNVIIQANMGQCDDDPLIAGQTATEQGAGVEGVTVNINSPSGFDNTVATDVDGNFMSAVPANGDFTVTPVHDVDPLNGVTTYDLVVISKHILGVDLLDSPYQVIAADANKSNTVTTFDLVELRKLILFINTEFPNNTSWRFVDKDFNFANPANPFASQFPEVINLNNVTAGQLAHDFVAIKVGDVNGSAAVNFASAEDRTMVGDLVLNADDIEMTEGQTYTVEFKATEFAVSGYQFTMNFDNDALSFNGIVPALADESNFGLTMVNEGVITTSWNSNEVKTLATDEVVFGLTFTAKQSGLLSELLSVNSRYTVAEAYTADAELLNVALSFNNTIVADGFELYQNTPNPFATQTIIGFYLPEATSATLTISDVQGKVVKVIDREFVKGYNQVELKRSDLGATGVLYYRLDTETDSATRMMILVD